MTDDWRRFVRRRRAEITSRAEEICRACLTPAGVDGANGGMTGLRLGRRATVCATDDVAARVEEMQFVLGEGPCVDAAAARSPVFVADLSDAGEGMQPLARISRLGRVGLYVRCSPSRCGSAPYPSARWISTGALLATSHSGRCAPRCRRPTRRRSCSWTSRTTSSCPTAWEAAGPISDSRSTPPPACSACSSAPASSRRSCGSAPWHSPSPDPSTRSLQTLSPAKLRVGEEGLV